MQRTMNNSIQIKCQTNITLIANPPKVYTTLHINKNPPKVHSIADPPPR